MTGEKKKKNMTDRRGGGQRKIPVSELRGVEYRKRPQSGEAEKRRPGKDERNAGNGKDGEKTVTGDEVEKKQVPG